MEALERIENRQEEGDFPLDRRIVVVALDDHRPCCEVAWETEGRTGRFGDEKKIGTWKEVVRKPGDLP